MLDRPVVALARVPSLAAVVLVTTALETAVVVPTLGLGMGAAYALLSRGVVVPAMAALAACAALAAGLLILVRTALALAPIEAVAGRANPIRAFIENFRRLPREFVGLVPLVVAGEAAVAAGVVACGAGALPGYPIGDLAVLHRWAELEERNQEEPT